MIDNLVDVKESDVGIEREGMQSLQVESESRRELEKNGGDDALLLVAAVVAAMVDQPATNLLRRIDFSCDTECYLYLQEHC